MEVQPLATYREVSIMGNRNYFLFEDHLKIEIRFKHRTHVDVRFDLRKMDINYMRLWVRPGPFTWAVFAMFLAVFIYFSWTSIDPDFYARALEVCGGIFAVGLVVAAVSFRKIEYVAFMESARVTLWDVGKCGPDKESFEAFINKTVAQIEKTKTKPTP